MQFDTWKPSSPDYANIDSELHMQLTTLFFFCNRPTIGALMGLGTDLGEAFKDPGSSESAGGSQEKPDESARLDRTASIVSEVEYEAGEQVFARGWLVETCIHRLCCMKVLAAWMVCKLQCKGARPHASLFDLGQCLLHAA